MSLSFIAACEGGKRKIAQVLLSNGEVDAKYTDEKGRTGLHYAAHKGYFDIVEMILRKAQTLTTRIIMEKYPSTLRAFKVKIKLRPTCWSRAQMPGSVTFKAIVCYILLLKMGKLRL